MIKRLTSVFFVCALLSSFLMIPVKAEVLTGTNQFSVFKAKTVDELRAGGSSAGQYDISYSQADIQKSLSDSAYTAYWYFGLDSLYGFANISSITGTVVVSFSYFFGSSDDQSFGSAGDYTPVTTFDRLTGTGLTGTGEFITFEPVTFEQYHSTGVTVTATFEGSENDPLSNPRIEWNPATLYGRMNKANPFTLYVPSYRVFSTSAPSADLAELQNIAKGIAESNRILSAMYGDILAVCNSIYERTGSILDAQNLTNQYFASIIPLLNNISSTTSNIYSLLSTQFSLLISTIQSESDDIQAAINAAVDRMIAYLDGAFSSSVNPALPGTSEDINTGVDSWNQAENGYQSNASERFQSITADFSGFSGDVLSGIGLASTLFQRVWNALGSYVVLYTVPLTLSLCLLVVGRVSRSHSRGGGSSKSKDDGGGT